MAKSAPDLTISSLRGGLNTDDPPSELKRDQCVAAMNVEFRDAACGERRRGATAIDMSPYEGDFYYIPMLGKHRTGLGDINQLWAVGTLDVTGNDATFVYRYVNQSSWTTVVPDHAATDTVLAHSLEGTVPLSFHNKFFIPCWSVYFDGFTLSRDRMLVWDNVSLRWAGIGEPDAPVVTNGGTFGPPYSGTRYFRVRWRIMSGDTIVRRSEPSEATTLEPPGLNDSAVIAMPALIGEGETHWEIEASLDNATWYRISYQLTSTPTYTDYTPYATGYALAGVLSDDIGDHTPLPSAAFLTVDEDRLVMAGSFADNGALSRVSWTPVNGDPGVGNDERVPIATTNFLDLDTGDGGGITGISEASNGFFYVFKKSHIYKMVRTGVRDQAYEATVVSKSLGAMTGSVVSGLDEFGRSCIYALDPSLGPYRIGASGLQLHHGLGSKTNQYSTWSTVLDTTNTHSVYYADSRQVIWWVRSTSVDGANSSSAPTLKIVLQTDATRATETGFEGGVSLGDGKSAIVLSACMFDKGVNIPNFVPYVATADSDHGDPTVLQLDVEDSTEDDGVAYAATLTTSPFLSAGQLNRFGTLAAGVLARASDVEGLRVILGQSRDFQNEEKASYINLEPLSSETEVVRVADESGFAGLRALQVTLRDDDLEGAPMGRWEVIQIALSQSSQETS